MSDLIKREDAINSIFKRKKTVPTIKQDVLAYCDGLFDAIEIVQDLPSADRPQGEWVFDEKGYFRCSECWRKPKDQTSTTDFCPWCGAKMKGADDETR